LTNTALKEKLGTIIARLNTHGVIGEDLISVEQLSNLIGGLNEPSKEAKIAVEMLSSVDAFINNDEHSEKITELIKQSPAARSILVHALVGVENNGRLQTVMENLTESISVDDPISAKDWISLYQKVSLNNQWQISVKDKIDRILDSDESKDRMLQHELAVLINDKNLASEFPTEVNLQKLSEKLYVSSPEKQEMKSGLERAKDFFLGGLKGFGVKETEAGSRWAALQNNMFDVKGSKSRSAREWIQAIAVKEGIYAPWARRGDSAFLNDLSPLDVGLTQKLNPSRAYNPFVGISFGLSVLEVGLNRVTAFPQPFKTLGLGLKGLGLVLIRPLKSVFHILGNLSSVSGSRDNPILDLLKQVQNQQSNLRELNVEQLNTDDFKQSNFSAFMNHRFYSSEGKKLSGKTARDEEITNACLDISLDLNALKTDNATNAINLMNKKASDLIALRNVMLSVEMRSPKTSEDQRMLTVLNQSIDSQLTELKKSIDMSNADRAQKSEEALSKDIPYDAELGAVDKVTADLSPRSESPRGMSDTESLGSPRTEAGSQEEYSESDGEGYEAGELSEKEMKGARSGGDISSASLSEREKVLQKSEGLGKSGAEVSADKGSEAAAMREAAVIKEVMGVRFEYNEVRLLGFSEKLSEPDLQEDLQQWVKSLGLGAPVGEASETGELKFPIKFQGGQKVEVKGKDVVLKGFSEEAYSNLKVILSEVLSQSPVFTVSGADSTSYARAAEGMGFGGEKDVWSRLSSVRLFFEQTWDKIKYNVSSAFNNLLARIGLEGAEKTDQSPQAPVTISSEKVSATAAENEESTVGLDASASLGAENKTSRVSSPPPTPTPELRESQKERPMAAKPHFPAKMQDVSTPTPVIGTDVKQPPAVPPKPSKENIPTKPKGLGNGPTASWVRVKVTIAQEPDFQALKATCDRVAQNNGVSVVYNGGKNHHEFKAVLSDREGGEIAISASQSNKQVVVEELNSSSVSLQNMANLVTALPPSGQKNYEVSGGGKDRQRAFNKQYQAAVNKTTKAEQPSQNRLSRSE
jgi:hypothetical protein